MKIYILPIDKKFQTETMIYAYPQHNDDFGVEQDFHKYLLDNKELLTPDPLEADWHYLPIYWTRWHVNHNYAKEGLKEMQDQVATQILDSKKTFTICQYDDGPVVDVGQTLVFLASRMTSRGIDIPLLSRPHKNQFSNILSKKYVASFVGSLKAHQLRVDMAKALQEKSDVYIFDSHKTRSKLVQKLWQAYIVLWFGDRSAFFVTKALQSYVALCPRGYGGSSFRFFEAMQLGVAPFLIGDIDTRPFKKYINWDEISFYTSDANKIMEIINSQSKEKLLAMGKKAQEVYYQKLAYRVWCPLVLKELDNQ